MSVRYGMTYGQIVQSLSTKFEATRRMAELEAGKMAGSYPVDNMSNNVWHECRRIKDMIAKWRQRAENLGATPAQGRQNLRDRAESEYGSTYDIIAETQQFLALVDAVQDAAKTALGGTDANDFVQGNYIKLSDVSPFFDQLDTATTAPVVVALNALAAFAIE